MQCSHSRAHRQKQRGVLLGGCFCRETTLKAKVRALRPGMTESMGCLVMPSKQDPLSLQPTSPGPSLWDALGLN